MTELKNIDDMLIQDMQQDGDKISPVESIESNNKNIDNTSGNLENIDNNQSDSNETIQNIGENQSKTDKDSQTSENGSLETTSQNTDSPIDEYGNPIEKPKLYTQDEVQAMIRDRLSRGRNAEQQYQPPQQQVQQDASNFKPDENSEESWEVQLENFIDKTIQKRQQEHQRKQWEETQRVVQSDFESKFTTGMGKYADFHNVVQGKPFTDNMLLAIRSLNDPAAFVYAASKMHPQEIDRISRIQDPYQQASEMGRLHEKMVKVRAASANQARPLESPKSDVATPIKTQPSIDERISQHAKQKFARK